jgi:hypothetical protein
LVWVNLRWPALVPRAAGVGRLADARTDDTSLLLDARRVPPRVQPPKGLQAF